MKQKMMLLYIQDIIIITQNLLTICCRHRYHFVGIRKFKRIVKSINPRVGARRILHSIIKYSALVFHPRPKYTYAVYRATLDANGACA